MWRDARALVIRLFTVDSRSLALLRIGVAAVILLDLGATRLPDLVPFYSDEGMLPISVSGGPKAAPGHWSLHEWHPATAYQAALMYVAAGAAACLLAGCWTRAATLVSWVLAVSLANRNPLVCNYGDTVLQLLLFWSVWIPWGRTWSVDAWRQARHGAIPGAGEGVCSIATGCALVQLVILYFFAGMWKWNREWLTGAAVEHALELEYATRSTAEVLARFPGLLGVLTQATLALELAGPLLVWIPWHTERIRLAMVVAFVGLHVGIELFFTPLYLSHICIVAWSLFLPPLFWEMRGLRRLTRAWDAWMARQTARSEKREDGLVPHARTSVPWWPSRMAARLVLLLLLVYVLLWNVATFDLKRLGFLLPERIRWLGHVTLLRQTWDMFWIPSRYNGWFEARALLADGRQLDVLGSRPWPVNPPMPGWSAMPNPRWKVYFRRLTESPDPELCQLVADYLWRTWNSSHPPGQRIERLELVLVRRGDPRQHGRDGITEETVGRVEDPASDALDELLRRLGRSAD